jgi:hypothetical protein
MLQQADLITPRLVPGAAQRSMHHAHLVDAVVVPVHPFDDRLQLGVAGRARRRRTAFAA